MTLLDTTDPIITAIQNFRTGLAHFEVIPSAVTQRMEAQIIEATYGPPHQVLVDWTAPAETFEGAVEALRLARDENNQIAGGDIANNMVEAALAYFEKATPAHGQEGRA